MIWRESGWQTRARWGDPRVTRGVLLRKDRNKIVFYLQCFLCWRVNSVKAPTYHSLSIIYWYRKILLIANNSSLSSDIIRRLLLAINPHNVHPIIFCHHDNSQCYCCSPFTVTDWNLELINNLTVLICSRSSRPIDHSLTSAVKISHWSDRDRGVKWMGWWAAEER